MANRVSQDAIEALTQNTPSTRVSQAATEVLANINNNVRLSQIAIEAITPAGHPRTSLVMVEGTRQAFKP